MKNLLLLFTFLSLISIGCNQKSKEEVKVMQTNVNELDTLSDRDLEFEKEYGATRDVILIKIANNIIDLVKNNDKEAIANLISYYPLEREYPIPSIKNKQEFIKRYDEIFDDACKKTIINSNPSTDCEELGWKGIFFNGIWLWYDGAIQGIYCDSSFEKELREKLIDAEKANLHPTIREFEYPMHILETKKYRIRIDYLGGTDTYSNYRYSSWSINKTMKEDPDFVICGGTRTSDGSGGNHYYEFINGEYLYKCWIWEMRQADTSPASLVIYKGEEQILNQDAEIILR